MATSLPRYRYELSIDTCDEEKRQRRGDSASAIALKRSDEHSDEKKNYYRKETQKSWTQIRFGHSTTAKSTSRKKNTHDLPNFTEFYPHFPVSAASNIIYLSAKCNNKSNEKQNALTVYLFEFLDMIHISEYSRVEIPQQWVVTP